MNENINLTTLTIPPNLFTENLEAIQSTPGFSVFGDESLIPSLPALVTFFDKHIGFAHEFAHANVRQYQVPSIYVLLLTARALYDKALAENNTSHLLVARNHINTCYDLADMLMMGLHQRDLPGIMMHPTFQPTEADMLKFSAFIYTQAFIIKALGDEIGARVQEARAAK